MNQSRNRDSGAHLPILGRWQRRPVIVDLQVAPGAQACLTQRWPCRAEEQEPARLQALEGVSGRTLEAVIYHIAIGGERLLCLCHPLRASALGSEEGDVSFVVLIKPNCLSV
jgi:hypothetical protein